MIKSLATRPIPGVICLLANSVESSEAGFVMAVCACRDMVGAVRRAMLSSDLWSDMANGRGDDEGQMQPRRADYIPVHSRLNISQ
jgi:hypothetical protein